MKTCDEYKYLGIKISREDNINRKLNLKKNSTGKISHPETECAPMVERN
jgi:hypothetical protein